METDDKDVVILAHTCSGIPAGGAAHGLSNTSRNDRKGGVLGMIYLSAFVVPEGTSLLDYLGGKHAPYLVADQVSIQLPNAAAFSVYHLPAATNDMCVFSLAV